MTSARLVQSQLDQLWDAIQNLSLPAAIQLRLLESAGNRNAVDELALAFDDVIWILSDKHGRAHFAQEEAAAISRLDAYLTAMSGPQHEAKWTPAALESHHAWSSVRRLARQALGMRQLSRMQHAET